MGKYTEFGNFEMHDHKISGYMILGCINGKYFHIYGDDDKNILFADNGFKGNIKTKDCPFIIFEKLEDALEDAIALKKCCYNDAYQLSMKIADCCIKEKTSYRSGKFLGYNAYLSNEIIINELK